MGKKTLKVPCAKLDFEAILIQLPLGKLVEDSLGRNGKEKESVKKIYYT